MNTQKLTAISSALLLSVAMVPSVSAHDGGYLSDRYGNPVRDGNGECIKTISGNMLEGCGTPTHEPVVEEAPVPEPTPAVVVAPAPVPTPVMAPKPPMPKPIVRAPAPKVHILNLNESGGSNFATDSAELSAKARLQLIGFADTVKVSRVSPSSITIIGHTDSRGSNSHNQKLSDRRAQSVASFLASQGMNRGVMHVEGKGESQPVDSNNTKAGRAANRRVTIAANGQSRVIGK